MQVLGYKSITLFFVLLVVLFLGFSVLAKDFTYVATSTSSPTPTPTPISLLEKIELGKNLLKQSSPLIIEKNKIGQVTRKQISLAILNKQTGEITEHRYWFKQSEIQNYSKKRVINPEPVALNEPLLPNVKWWNSFNSYFEIANNPELVVIGNKYPLLSKSIPDPKQRSAKEYTDIIYVPHSEALQTPELVQAGKDYIKEKIDAAFLFLDKNGVKSKSVPGKLVSDVVSKDFLKNIIVVEHVDPIAFSLADDGGQVLTDRVLTIIGANRENAYSYTGSPAGANGIAQFISPTYRTLRLTYPSAELISDFILGTATHENAFKAMALFIDNYKADIQNKITRKEVLSQLGGVSEEMMSAAYNGGPNRVVRAVNTHGSNWLASQFTASITKVFRPETLSYLNKFQAIRNMRLF